MSDRPLIAIAVPSGDMVHTDFAMSLAMLMQSPVPQGGQAFLLNARSSLIAVGRNQSAGAAQVMKATHLLFIDTDIVFPHDTLARLMSHNKDVVGATYSKRMPPFHPLTENEAGEVVQIDSGMHRVRLIPTGCLLIRMPVFNAMTKPYFNTVAEGDQLRGEDYYFCEQARKAGFELWCDGDLSSQLGHIGQKIHRLSDTAVHTGKIG